MYPNQPERESTQRIRAVRDDVNAFHVAGVPVYPSLCLRSSGDGYLHQTRYDGGGALFSGGTNQSKTHARQQAADKRKIIGVVNCRGNSRSCCLGPGDGGQRGRRRGAQRGKREGGERARGPPQGGRGALRTMTGRGEGGGRWKFALARRWKEGCAMERCREMVVCWFSFGSLLSPCLALPTLQHGCNSSSRGAKSGSEDRSLSTQWPLGRGGETGIISP